ncbi:hypothetical protein [Nocardia jinanensis]|uniref:DUF8020 domain-containing protein n=1 Tax=Nocardia jinanensis TaxID=382504 RepID=A0A917R572_9NOCA|nr:hypothetical protein [Nocardia jinanensis]GGK91226.1 hypothetical protein GCM10011588_01930 [Nocardia jinanensis]
MKIRTSVATAAIAVASLGAAAAPAHAQPAPAPRELTYEITQEGASAVVETNGEWQVAGDQLILKAVDDTPLTTVPLIYRRDDVAFPIAAHIEGGTAVLTPQRDGGVPVAPVHAPVITPEQAGEEIAEQFTPRDMQALGVFTQRATMSAAIAGAIGAVLGGSLGCVLGAATGALVSSPIALLLVPFVGATIGGCVAGAATLGAAGGIIGAFLIGGPVAVFAAFQYFSTILSPCPPEHPACRPTTP